MTFDLTVNNLAPELDDTTFSVVENAEDGTPIGTLNASDAGDDTLSYSIVSASGETVFTIDSATGEITILDSTQLDYETTTTFELEVEVTDEDGGANTATVTINLLNQASISGVVFVDLDGNGLYDANEPGIDGVLVELLDDNGDAMLNAQGAAITAVTGDGGFYLLEDLDPGEYRLRELQPTGVDDGAELIGSLGGTIVDNDLMQLLVERQNAFDYAFAEIGQNVSAGDTATIGFWQNKHGQALIASGGAQLAQWLTASFSNVFGGSLSSASGEDVAQFYRDQLFKQKAKKSAGPAKVDAQFMAVALATYFTSSNLAGSIAAEYGFNVSDTGIGTRLINVGSAGAAFGVANGTDMTIMQLLLATDSLTDVPDDVTNFSDNRLALASNSTNIVWIDVDAAGHGWFVDSAGMDASAGTMDLLTAVTHELGHVLGKRDLDPHLHSDDVMAGVLEPRHRRLPSTVRGFALVSEPRGAAVHAHPFGASHGRRGTLARSRGRRSHAGCPSLIHLPASRPGV